MDRVSRDRGNRTLSPSSSSAFDRRNSSPSAPNRPHYIYATPVKCKSERFSEGEDKRFRGGVYSYVRKRLKRGIGSDVDDAAMAALYHLRAKPVRQTHYRMHVHLDACQFLSDVVGEKAARQVQTGVIDEEIRFLPLTIETLGSVVRRQVQRDRLH